MPDPNWTIVSFDSWIAAFKAMREYAPKGAWEGIHVVGFVSATQAGMAVYRLTHRPVQGLPITLEYMFPYDLGVPEYRQTGPGTPRDGAPQSAGRLIRTGMVIQRTIVYKHMAAFVRRRSGTINSWSQIEHFLRITGVVSSLFRDASQDYQLQEALYWTRTLSEHQLDAYFAGADEEATDPTQAARTRRNEATTQRTGKTLDELVADSRRSMEYPANRWGTNVYYSSKTKTYVPLEDLEVSDRTTPDIIPDWLNVLVEDN